MSYSAFPTWRSGNHDAVCVYMSITGRRKTYKCPVFPERSVRPHLKRESEAASCLLPSNQRRRLRLNRKQKNRLRRLKGRQTYSRPHSGFVSRSLQNQIKMSRVKMIQQNRNHIKKRKLILCLFFVMFCFLFRCFDSNLRQETMTPFSFSVQLP